MFRQLYPVAIKPSVYKSVSQKKNLLVLDWNQFKYDYITNANANTNSKRNLHLLLQSCSLLSPVEHFPDLVARFAFVQENHRDKKKVLEYFDEDLNSAISKYFD